MLDTLWRRAITELTHFVNEHNRLPGRADVDYGSVNYKTWLTTRRRELKDGMLSSSRKGDLDGVFPGWENVRIQNDVWSQTVDETIGFVRLSGEPLISGSSETELRLARWLDRQRELGKYGMTKVRYARLNAEFSDWELLSSDMNGFVCQGPMRIKRTHGESPYSGVDAHTSSNLAATTRISV
ncbi:hypothetical protein F1C58_16755 (plasmid) [Glaciihabitans sp. INWT7]|uniref:hypothetical protein n=1 Tax=Glaciihabitans sp. INWT7 TaxID=2596912 RepID=UPI00162A16B4|nr:hypothetical protein [Glaciihabitans sp. INWT7]QNE48708.1 hypothetical protein F1C58_16755 [Glaciihabitans sp. INWT7]